MAERRSLVEGTKPAPSPEMRAVENQFVFGKSKPSNDQPVNRIPLTSKIRPDLYKTLKRASLERQLEGITPHDIQDILEACIEPWLRQQGYLH